MELPGRAGWLPAALGPPGNQDSRLLAEGHTHRTEATPSGSGRGLKRDCAPLRSGASGIEEWRGRLCGKVWNGLSGDQEPDYMHPGDTRDVQRGEDVCGAIQLGTSGDCNQGGLLERGPSPMEGRWRMDLWLP